MSDPNPYESPRHALEPPRPDEQVSIRLRPILLGTFVGMLLGYFVFGYILRGPGNPYGMFLAPAEGGFIGLGVGIYYRLRAKS